MRLPTQKLTLSGLFVALGLLVPMLFHAVGLGSIFLPMFWPVAASAFFLSFPYALAVGVLTPVFSSLLTGMPPISPPIVYIMLLELGFLAGITSLLHERTKWGLVWILLIGLAISRLVLFMCTALFAPLLGLPEKVFSIVMVAKGMPGVALILIFIPLLVNRAKHEAIFLSRT